MSNGSLKRIAIACTMAFFAAVAVVTFARASGSDSTPVSITLPPDAQSFGLGAGQSVAQAKCTICHAADYVYTQPPLTDVQWRAEVVKMKNAFGAPLNDVDVDTLVAYLVRQNGKK
jgi:mono/diheme cytochrome c family protein